MPDYRSAARRAPRRALPRPQTRPNTTDAGYRGVYVNAAPVTGPVCDQKDAGGLPVSIPDSSTNGAGCKCNSGHTTADQTSCRETTNADCGAAGTHVDGADDNVYPRGSGGGACVNGCKIQGSGSVTGPAGGGSSGTTSVTYGPFQNTGQACNSSTNATPVSPTGASCAKQGMGVGTVNNVSVCVPATSTSTTKTSVTQSTSASGVGSSSTTTTETTDNKDGTTTTTTTTTRSDGSSRTTTTTGPTPLAGGGGGSASDPGSDFCRLHPDLQVCKVSTFGGSCSASFTCDGDAVQCAIAKDQHERNCAFFEPGAAPGASKDASDRFNQAVQDGDTPSWSPAASGAQSSAPLDMTTDISTTKHWGGGCVEDQVVVLTVLHRAVVIPWSSWCTQMQMIGKLLIAVTTLVCVGIVFKN